MLGRVFVSCLNTLYTLNQKTVNNQWLSQLLWQSIKHQLFEISGQCQHTGHCCKEIMLHHNHKALDTIIAFKNRLKKDPSLNRFIPKTHPNTSQIKHYNCSCLSPNNRCSDYANRPKLCQNYPYSHFLNDKPLYSNCGYRIQKKQALPKNIHPEIQEKIQTLY